MSQLVDEYGHVLLMATVFFEQMGLPLPAYPSLLLAGAIPASMTGMGALCATLGMVVAACLAADTAWYWAGRRYGSALTRGVCRFSISPSACVVTSNNAFRRFGPRSLLVAKFLPGAGAITTLLAGASGTRLRIFLLYDLGGSALWAGSALVLGFVFQETVMVVFKAVRPYIVTGLIGFILLTCAAIAVLVYRRRQERVSLELKPIMHASRLISLRSAPGEPQGIRGISENSSSGSTRSITRGSNAGNSMTSLTY
ncbi:DedA family protein [Bordetella petrii]|uniref:DedA family protein n=1 Tax=Bordetella petrii TaxID=94624 RepID=UPI001A95D650|nr:DedA family protein [Bordetella petrii]MBO1114051.1 DedA family protein [Bordetella petrii]